MGSWDRPSHELLPLIPRKFHADAEVYLFDKDLIENDKFGILFGKDDGIFIIRPPASVREKASSERSYLVDMYGFGGTMNRNVAIDCLRAGWMVWEVKVKYESVFSGIMYRFRDHWRYEGAWWGWFDGRTSEFWVPEYEISLDITGNLRAWLEHLPDTTYMDEANELYMNEVIENNSLFWFDELKRTRGRYKTAREIEAMDKKAEAEETEAEKAEGNGPFAIGIDNTYGHIAIVSFGVLYFYWLYLGFTQFCHDLALWAEWIFSFLF